MNYHPNQLAVGLRNRKTKTIGLLLPDIRNNFFSTLAKHAEDACRRRGWTLILCNTGDHHKRDIEYIHVLFSKKVDGILYCMSADTDAEKFQKIYSLLKSMSMPYIMIDRSYDLPEQIAAKINHRLGGFLAADHLLQLGHRRIACITGPSHLQESHDRLDGYKHALQKYHVDFDETLVCEGNYQVSGGRQGIHLLGDTPYTALFCFNDLMAFGAMQILKTQNRIVPDDISVVGYDDIIFANMLDVPLTTVQQPVGRAGRMAVENLIASIEENRPIDPIPELDPLLVVRDSTRPLS